MNVLALELSTAEKSVALGTASGKVYERIWYEDRSRPDPLYEMLSEVRADSGLRWDDLAGILIGRGPGQYSGMRAAAAAAQGLALPGGLPVTGISSGAAQAWRMFREPPQAEKAIAVLGDARRDRWWMGLFEMQGDALQPVLDWDLYTEDDLVSTVTAHKGYAVTSDWDRCSELLQAMFFGENSLHQGAFFPRASDLLSLHALREELGEDAEPPLPIYLHPPVAPPVVPC